MKRSLILYFFTLVFGIGILHAEGVGTRHVVDCGTWMELTATPAEDYHFVRWNDNNTDSVRQIQVHEDAHYIAFFAPNCGAYADLPIVARYDWLLMLDVRSMKLRGYQLEENDVTWYRVVGQLDDLEDPSTWDDLVMCHGFYLTIDQNLNGTGVYYAVFDASSSSSNVLCHDLMRSQIISYSSHQNAISAIRLNKNVVHRGEELRLLGLTADEWTKINVYSVSGKMLQSIDTHGVESYSIQAPMVCGCYLIHVTRPSGQCTLRFIVQ